MKMSDKNKLKNSVMTDNLEHYIDCITELRDKLVKFKTIPSYVILDDDFNKVNVTSTTDLYSFIINELDNIQYVMENDDDLK
jgi:hypothetical protein